MTTFQDRERAFEAKFAHDEAFRYLVGARRDKLFAQWAADRLGLSQDAARELLLTTIAVRDGADHDKLLLAHMAAVFAAHGETSIGREELSAALQRCALHARQQLLDTPSNLPEGLQAP